jgi:hypothetical protein
MEGFVINILLYTIYIYIHIINQRNTPISRFRASRGGEGMSGGVFDMQGWELGTWALLAKFNGPVWSLQ